MKHLPLRTLKVCEIFYQRDKFDRFASSAVTFVLSFGFYVRCQIQCAKPHINLCISAWITARPSDLLNTARLQGGLRCVAIQFQRFVPAIFPNEIGG